MKKKVLIVDDDIYGAYFREWHKILDDKVEIIEARSIKEAEEKFATDITAIVMDACVPGDVPTTQPLVWKFRETFKGPMIAISSDPNYRKELVLVGCDHESEKRSMPQKLLEILNL